MSARWVLLAALLVAAPVAAHAAGPVISGIPPLELTPEQRRLLHDPPHDPALLPKGVPDGWRVVEGDILVPVYVRESRILAPSGSYITSPVQLWPGGVVPFEFDANMNADMRMAAFQAMTLWATVGYPNRIIFRARTGDDLWFIHFQNSTVNNSAVGMVLNTINPGQVINIVSWSNIYIIAHEINHALGRYHEQMRLDRDTYVTINSGNICQTCCPNSDGDPAPCNHNFDKRGAGGDYGPYDFDSVMHYDQCSFSTNMNCPTGGGQTILVNAPWNATWQNTIGQRDHLSYGDQLATSFLYADPAWRFVDPQRGGADGNGGGFFSPWATLGKGLVSTPPGGTLWVEPGAYFGTVGTFGTPMTVRAPNGLATGR